MDKYFQEKQCVSYDDLSDPDRTDCVILQCASVDNVVTGKSDPPVIYVIDDDVRLRQTLRLVSNLTGYPLKVFDSHIDFLAVYRDGTGCLILNEKLDGMDGLQFARKLPGLKIYLPVIIVADMPDSLTSVTMNSDVVGIVSQSCHAEKLISIVCAAVGKMQVNEKKDLY